VDCNTNGVPDDCDIAGGTSTDFNLNGIPDDCETEVDFDPPLEFEALGEPSVEAVGDLDGDGTPDTVIIIPNPDPMLPGQIQVFLNQGTDGSGAWLGFVANEPILVGINPSDVAVGFLDNDVHLDVAVTNAGDNTVAILLNQGTGDGALTLAGTIPVGANPSSIIAAELNGDAFIDLAVTEQGSPLAVSPESLDAFLAGLLGTGDEGFVRILVNDGLAGFDDGGSKSTGGSATTAMEPDDVDNDKDTDMMGVNGLGSPGATESGSVFVIINEGGGVFADAVTFDVGVNPTDLATGDFNQDGFVDIAVTNAGDATVSVLLNQGAGLEGGSLFTVAGELPVGDQPQSVDVGDVDGDGDLDLAVVAEDEEIGPSVEVLENFAELGGAPLGSVSFGLPEAFSVDADPNFVVSADLNADFLFDLVTVNADISPSGGSVTALLSNPDPIALPASLDYEPSNCPNRVRLDGDGYLSIALLGASGFDVTQIDVTTLQLSRAANVGGSLAPNLGPPGPGLEFGNIVSPPVGPPCSCIGIAPDGTLDLLMRFRQQRMIEQLSLKDLLPVAQVEVKVEGTLLDGPFFQAFDCVIISVPTDVQGFP
jgi:hypothetical protein